jgi:hypothetical protein
VPEKDADEDDAGNLGAASILELPEVELPKARRIRKDVDLDDLSAPHRETHDGQRPSSWEPTDDFRHAVHKRQSGRLRKARERQGIYG